MKSATYFSLVVQSVPKKWALPWIFQSSIWFSAISYFRFRESKREREHARIESTLAHDVRLYVCVRVQSSTTAHSRNVEVSVENHEHLLGNPTQINGPVRVRPA